MNEVKKLEDTIFWALYRALTIGLITAILFYAIVALTGDQPFGRFVIALGVSIIDYVILVKLTKKLINKINNNTGEV